MKRTKRHMGNDEMAPKVMEWIDRLPEVGEPILKARDAIAAKLAEADALERR